MNVEEQVVEFHKNCAVKDFSIKLKKINPWHVGFEQEEKSK